MKLSQLKKYYLVCKLSFEDIFEYRLDFIIKVSKYTMMIILMSLVWIAVAKESQQVIFTDQEIVTYFVFASVLYSLSNFHPYYIEDDIRLGGLTKYLMKPVKPFWYYFFFEATNSFFEVAVRLLVMVPGLWLLGFRFPIFLPQASLVALLLPMIFLFCFCFLTTISAMAFWFQDVFAIRWSASIAARFASGILVPVIFMPEWYQKISFYLPFQHLAFTPIQVLQNKVSLQYGVESFLILSLWAVAALIIQQAFWRKGVLQYEGSGI
jgi:ABC-2 type transport system permease protein